MPDAPLPASRRFTGRQALNHSTGPREDPPIFPRGGDGRLWCGLEPGHRLSDFNTGFQLLGLLIERLTGLSLAEAIHRAVLAPLDTKATRGAIRDRDQALYAQGYNPRFRERVFLRRDPISPAVWTPFASGAGCVASAPGDRALYIAFLIRAGRGEGAPVLSDDGASLPKPPIQPPVRPGRFPPTGRPWPAAMIAAIRTG